MGFGQRRKYRPSAEHGGSLQVRATDTGHAWHVGNEGGRVRARRDASPAPAPGCVVSGPASGLYLFLWNRSDAAQANVTVSGDPGFLGCMAIQRPRPLGLAPARAWNCRSQVLSSNLCSIRYLAQIMSSRVVTSRPRTRPRPQTRLWPRRVCRWSALRPRSVSWPGIWPRRRAASWCCWAILMPGGAGRAGTCPAARRGCRGSARCPRARPGSTSGWRGRCATCP